MSQTYTLKRYFEDSVTEGEKIGFTLTASEADDEQIIYATISGDNYLHDILENNGDVDSFGNPDSGIISVDQFRSTSSQLVFTLKLSKEGKVHFFLRPRIDEYYDDGNGTYVFGKNSQKASESKDEKVYLRFYSDPNNIYNPIPSNLIAETSFTIKDVKDDYDASITTTGSIGIGETIIVNDETGSDNDWIKVDLVEGKTYKFRLYGEKWHFWNIYYPEVNLSTSEIAGIYNSNNENLLYAPAEGGELHGELLLPKENSYIKNRAHEIIFTCLKSDSYFISTGSKQQYANWNNGNTTGLISKHFLNVYELDNATTQDNTPTDITISNTTIDGTPNSLKHEKPGILYSHTIGELSTIDPDQKDKHIYRLSESSVGAGFSIDGNKLKWNQYFKSDFSLVNNSPYNVYITTQDNARNLYTKKLIITVNNVKASTSEDEVFDGNIDGKKIYMNSTYENYSFKRNHDSIILTSLTDGTDTLKNIEYIQFADQLVEEDKVDISKTYAGNFSDYKFYNKGNGVYQIKTDSGYDDITGLPLLTFSGEATTSSFRDISAIVDIKGTFEQVTGLDTDDAKMFRLYNASFKRLPDPDGLKYWIGKYSSGENDSRAVASSFLVSAEFKERYGENVSNAKYVETLYTNVLGRDYDQDGYNYWLGNLNAGTETRYELLLGFAEAAENKALFTEMTGFG